MTKLVVLFPKQMFYYQYLDKPMSQYDVCFKLDLALILVTCFSVSGCDKLIVRSESFFKQEETGINFSF